MWLPKANQAFGGLVALRGVVYMGPVSGARVVRGISSADDYRSQRAMQTSRIVELQQPQIALGPTLESHELQESLSHSIA